MKTIEAQIPMDGSDQTVALLDYIARAQREKSMLLLDDGVLGISQHIEVNGTVGAPIVIRGQGAGNMRVALSKIGAIKPPPCTMLKWVGDPSDEPETPMLSFKRCIGMGHGLEGVRLNGNNRAAHGLEVDGCAGGNYRNIMADWLANGIDSSYGIKIWTSTYGVTCSMNSFERLCVIANSTSPTNKGRALWLHGTAEGVGSVKGNDACHNRFSDTTLFAAGNRHSLELGFCDNNTFITTWAENNTGPGYGVFANFQNGQSNGAPTHNLFLYLTTPHWYNSLGARVVGQTGNTILGIDTQRGARVTVLSGFVHRLRDIGTTIENVIQPA